MRKILPYVLMIIYEALLLWGLYTITHDLVAVVGIAVLFGISGVFILKAQKSIRRTVGLGQPTNTQINTVFDKYMKSFKPFLIGFLVLLLITAALNLIGVFFRSR